MRFSTRLSIVAALAIAGLVPAVTAAATPAPHSRTAPSATTPLWVDLYKGKVGATEGFADAVSPNGSAVFVTGSMGSTNVRLHGVGVTVAYNPTSGALLWQTRLNTRFAWNAHFNAVAVSHDGSTVFATGEIQVGHSSTDIDAVTVAYNASTGAVLWTSNEPAMRAGNSIAVSPDDSTVFVTGLSGTQTGDPATLAYNAATGALLWSQSSGPSNGVSVKAAPDGSAVYVAGNNPAVEAYNPATGAVLWSAGSAGFTTINDLAVSPDGSTVYVTGTGTVSGVPSGYYRTGAFNAATGATLWTMNFQKAHRVGYAAALTVSPDGSTVFVTGEMLGATQNSGWGTVAYNAGTGAQLWVARFLTRSQVIAGTSIAISPDGTKVFVAGITTAASGMGQFGTAAYDAATGALLWISSSGRPLFSGIGRSVVVSPDGSTVFTAGATSVSSGADGSRMVTAAYSS